MRARLSSRWQLSLLVLLSCLLLGMVDEKFRYTRSVEARPGYNILELPLDVLAAAAPGLADLRLYAADREIPYAPQRVAGAPSTSLTLFDVESTPGNETSAYADRGPSPGLAQELTIEISETTPYLKPVMVEASDERGNFRVIARASVFQTETASNRTIHFPPSSRRYLRLRFDDRLAAPITPTAVTLHGITNEDEHPRELPIRLELDANAGANSTFDRYTLSLPSANLPAIGVALVVPGGVFSREVRVLERVLFRGEISRRPIGGGRIERLVDGSETLSVSVTEPRSTQLELEIERASSPLTVSAANLLIVPKRILFFAPEGEPLRLLYGAPIARAPRYDLVTVFERGAPKSAELATLGPVTDQGERSSLPPFERGPVLDASRYKTHRAVRLPSGGSVAYLDIPAHSPSAAYGVRLMAADKRQLPFVVESTPAHSRIPLQLTSELRGQTTVAKVSGHAGELLVGLELRAAAPAVFRREVQVYETTTDRRGPTGRRQLGAAVWEKRPEDTNAQLSLPLDSPASREVWLEIENGENAPLALSEAAGEVARARIDFAFEPGERLTLLSDDPRPTPARYDIAMLAERLFNATAGAAHLDPSPLVGPASSPDSSRKIWFWIAFAGAAALVVAALTRVLRPDPS